MHVAQDLAGPSLGQGAGSTDWYKLSRRVFIRVTISADASVGARGSNSSPAATGSLVD